MNALYIALNTIGGLGMFATGVYVTDSWWSIGVLCVAGITCGLLNIALRVPFRNNLMIQVIFNSAVCCIVVSMFYGYEAGSIVGTTNILVQGTLHLLEPFLLSPQAKEIRELLLDATTKR